MITSAKLSSRSIGLRTFFSRQLPLVLVAAALFAILWVVNVRGPGTGFLSILLYSLFIGNLTTPMMNRLAPLSSRLRFPWDWVAFLTFLFLTAVVIASLTVMIVERIRKQFSPEYAEFLLIQMRYSPRVSQP